MAIIIPTHLGGICTLSEENNPRSHSASIHAAIVLDFVVNSMDDDDDLLLGSVAKKCGIALGRIGDRFFFYPSIPLFCPLPHSKSKSKTAQNIQDNNHGAIS